MRWWWGAGAEPERLCRALAPVLDALAAGALENQKRGEHKALYSVSLGEGLGEAFLKVRGYRPGAGLRRAWLGSKARHELRVAEALAARGVPTPVPLAAGELRRGLRLERCLLVVPRVAGAVDLRRLAEAGVPARERRALAAAFGGLARAACDAGLFQDDFAPNNFLVRRSLVPELFMIDFERAALRPVGERERLFVLAKLLRELPGSSATDRLRFLRAFAGGDAAASRRLWAEVAAELPRRARRDARRLARVATRDGRRFRRLRGDGVGYAARDATEAALAAARGAEPGPGLQAVALPGISARAARAHWAGAVFLAARGLGPPPQALWRGPAATRVVVAAPEGAAPPGPGPDAPDEEAALRGLLKRLMALGEWQGEPGAADFLVWREGGRSRALLLAPGRMRFAGRAHPAAAAAAARLARRALEQPSPKG